jgi:quinol monooxygenase YgiN
MPSEKFQTVVAQIKAKLEFVETVKRECLALIEPSRADKGCLNYDLYQSTEDSTLFIFYENWESLKDLERHLDSPHALAFDEKTSGMLAKPEEITYLEKIG